MTIIFEFTPEQADFGPFVLNEILWLKYKVFPSKVLVFLLFFFDVGMVYLVGMCCNCYIIFYPIRCICKVKVLDKV